MFRSRRGVSVVILLGLLAGCGGGGSPDEANRRYVAIGDSYVSGPRIDVQDAEAPNCVRSDRNYPHRVAKQLKRTSLVDVSCGGATTSTVQKGRKIAQGGGSTTPQLDALTPETKLVTVGAGANDAGLYLGLFVRCLIKTSATDAKCTTFTDGYATTIYGGTRDRVAALLSKVKQLAPEARVLLVGYLRIVPDSGDCAILPLTETERAKAMKVEVALTGALRDAARSADVPFVDARRMSQGHDACAGEDAWVNGAANVPGDGALLHPNAAGMRAVAGMVLKDVDQS